MPTINQHPTVLAVRNRPPAAAQTLLTADWLRELCLASGADDVGFVALDRSELDDQRSDIVKYFGATRTLISVVCRMNREAVRATARSVSNLEFHLTTDATNEVCRRIVRKLDQAGVTALNATAGFPMEMSQFPGKVWAVSHKPVAVAAGLGKMGIHRNVIHPKFGNFIILGTILMAADIDRQTHPIDYNPCLECKLCVAACPVGAIEADGHFNANACMTHNYREFMSGFTDWVEQVADSKNAVDYRHKVTDSETASVWQSLSFGANYKAAYCLAVCPAGEEVIAPFLDDRTTFLSTHVKPLQEKKEAVYVIAQSDAEEYVKRRFPHKAPKLVHGVRPTTIAGFVFGLKIVFQRGQAKGINARYHFRFTGSENLEATVEIRDQELEVFEGLRGAADCSVTADSETWLGFVRRERNIVWAILRRKIRVKGGISMLQMFGRCFPA